MIARRLAFAAVASLCSLVVALLLLVSVAAAAAPPLVEEDSALNVAGTSATLQAQIDPEGSETTYRFEYGTSEAYGSQTPIPDGLLGSGVAGVTVTAHLQGLLPSTTYHYRVLATATATSETVDGPDQTFSTQGAGHEFSLPDGRQWEMVSPPNKHGATIFPITEEGVVEASADGSKISYAADAPIEDVPEGFSNEAQVLSTRGTQAWSSRNIATPHNGATGVSIGNGYEYRAFSPDLSLALVEPQGPFTPLSPEATDRTAYLRHDETCEATPTTCYTPLVTAANVAPGTEFGGELALRSNVNFVGASPDMSHVVLHSPTALTSAPGDDGGLYVWAGGKLELVSQLPASEGGMSTGEVAIGYESGGDNARHAISDDGSRIFWKTTNAGGGGLYMRDTATGHTVRLDVPQGNPEPVSVFVKAEFQTASADGSKAFFTDAERLTEDSTTKLTSSSEPDLYELNAVTGKLSDLTVDHNSGEAADVIAVTAASEDGTSVYFVALGVLTTVENSSHEKAATGQHNLYVEHYNGTEWETPTFIAGLSNEDAPDWAGVELNDLTVRASPNGDWLAFMSQRSLTGYDTLDAVSGQPDEEVYLYHATTNRLACASCNPTGARPAGTSYGEGIYGKVGLLGGGDRVWGSNTWLAANIPGWTPYALGRAVYQSRYLSDSGRLFFNSSDMLIPQDVNGTWDVYQFEPEGVGSCDGASTTFSERSGGCVGLVSSGTSAEQSAFVDASEDGDDVFFLTTSRLATQDFDTSLDVYDAHVCSAAEPCESAPVSPPPCNTGDSCKAAPSPESAAFGAPSSSTFAGAGNVSVSPPKPRVKPKSLTRAQKLTRALRACVKQPKRKRARCRTRARKQYGATQSHKVNATKKGNR